MENGAQRAIQIIFVLYAKKVNFKHRVVSYLHEHAHICTCNNIFSSDVEINTNLGFDYLIVKRNKKRFNDARDDCIAKGYALASVISQQELNFLKTFA